MYVNEIKHDMHKRIAKIKANISRFLLSRFIDSNLKQIWYFFESVKDKTIRFFPFYLPMLAVIKFLSSFYGIFLFQSVIKAKRENLSH